MSFSRHVNEKKNCSVFVGLESHPGPIEILHTTVIQKQGSKLPTGCMGQWPDADLI